jgi:hypothetical protein
MISSKKLLSRNSRQTRSFNKQKKIVWIAILFIFKFVQFPPFAIGGKGFFPEFFLFFSKQSESFSEKMGEKSFPDGEKR